VSGVPGARVARMCGKTGMLREKLRERLREKLRETARP
jgi:hypothetical protein